jgi:hypothetical protein
MLGRAYPAPDQQRRDPRARRRPRRGRHGDQRRGARHAHGTAKGRIARSATAKHAFQKSHPCPTTGKTSGACKGYVIDQVEPLKRGGADSPGNMQWQTTAAARAKNKVE